METLQRTANRGSVSTGPYEIDNSLKIEADNSERMQRASESIGTPTSTQKATISLWVKRTELKSSGNHFCWLGNAGAVTSFIGFNDDCLRWISDVSNAGVLKSNAVFRDTSAWYHIVFAFDTTQSTASNRIKAYVNGVQITSWSTETYPNQNNAIGIYETNMSHYIGWEDAGQQSGYFAEIYLIDGQQLAPTEFGEFDEDTGIWKPKAYSGTFGNEGYHLDFEDSSSLGADVSGNSNNFANLYSISAADQATDTPTNNFCTWNPLWAFYRNSTITEGGTVVAGAAGGWSHAGPTMGVMNGRWYWEWKVTTTENGFISFSTLEGNLNLNQLAHDNSVVMGYQAGHLYTWLGGSQGSNESTGWGTWAVNDIISIFLDVENSDRRFTLYKNGSAISGTTSFPVSMPNQMQVANGGGNIFPYNVQYENDGGEWNFGGYTTISNTRSYSDANGYGSFVYNPVLSGVNYYAICTKNLAEFG